MSGDRIGQWARRGYIRSSQSTTSPRVYSFQDVAEAMVVHELLRADVPLRMIRKTIGALRETYGDWPLTAADLRVTSASEGRVAKLFVKEGEHLYDADRERWQTVIDPGNLRRIVRDLRRGGWVVRDMPDLEHIEVNPDRLSGRPTIKGRRIPAEDVGAAAATREGWQLMREDYDLSDEEINDARRWWVAASQAS